jgi:hypothetical protein
MKKPYHILASLIVATLALVAALSSSYRPAKATVYLIYGGSSTPSPTPSPTATPTPTPTPGMPASPTPIPSPCGIAAGCVYANSVTGSDSNNGTSPSTPVLTLQKAESLSAAGKTVVLETSGGSGTWLSPSGVMVAVNIGGTSGNPVTYQCDKVTYPASCTMNGNGVGTYGFNFNVNGLGYINMVGIRVTGFTVGVSENEGSNGPGNGNSNNNFLWGRLDHNGDGARVNDYSSNDWFNYSEIDNNGSATGNPNHNQDHGLYLSCDQCGAYASVFHDNVYGWDVQYASEHNMSPLYTVILENDTFGAHSNTGPNIGNIVIFANGFTTPNSTIQNDIFMASINGTPITCYSVGVTGTPALIFSHDLLGSNNPITNCTGGSQTVTGNILNTNPQFISASPTSATDYELQTISPALGAGTNLTGTIPYDFLGVPYTVPQTMGAFNGGT